MAIPQGIVGSILPHASQGRRHIAHDPLASELGTLLSVHARTGAQ
jgi:hypothetical protein